MKSLRKTIRKLILETTDAYVEKLNTMMVDASEESWNQIIELIETLYGDNPPPDLKVWGIVEVEEGEVLLNGVTQDEALNFSHPDYVFCDPDGNVVAEPQLYPGDTVYCVIYKDHLIE